MSTSEVVYLKASAVERAQLAPALPVPRRVASAVLVALMALGGIATFTVVPGAGLWLASLLAGSSALLPLLAVVGIPVAMVLFASQLVRLDRLHSGLIAAPAVGDARTIPAYRRSNSDTRGRRPSTMLETIMVASVIVAAIAWLVWFFVFAGSPLPS